MSYFKDIQYMHSKHEIEYVGEPRDLPKETQNLRLKLLLEEFNEYNLAVIKKDRHEILDALVDICVVAIGTAAQHGFDFDEAWDRVLAANLKKYAAKTPEDIERSKRKIHGDLVKPEGWVAPDLRDLVE